MYAEAVSGIAQRTSSGEQAAPRTSAFLYTSLCVLLVVDGWRALLTIPEAKDILLPGVSTDAIVVAVAGLFLLVVGLRHRSRRAGLSNTSIVALGALCGTLFFARDFGTALLDPTNIAWVLSGDWAQHYSGWALFRNSPWAWPPGLMPQLWFPIGTSIVYTDSLPLLAMPLKAVSALLPDNFQYIGATFLLNCLLQGVFGALLTSRADRRPLSIVVGAMFFLLAPIFLRRWVHDTLMFQWVILAAAWMYFLPARIERLGLGWIVLAGVAALAHPYIAVMTLGIEAAWVIRIMCDSRNTFRRALAIFLASSSTTAALWYLSGAFLIHENDSGGGVKLGRFSFNLLGFINPLGYSRWLPDLPYFSDQYEGFAYLGVGVLIAALVAVALAVRGKGMHRNVTLWPLAIVSVALLILAASSVVTIGRIVLLDYSMGQGWVDVFRSSGRFVWPAYYLCVLASLWVVLRGLGEPWGIRVLLLCLFLQIADFSIAHAVLGDLRFQAHVEPKDAELRDDRWGDIAQGKKHLTLLPPKACGHQAGGYLPFVLLAAQYHLTLNGGYLARWDSQATHSYCEALHQRAMSGEFENDELLVVDPSWDTLLRASSVPLRCVDIEGYRACEVHRRLHAASD
jgi:uncharacterized protein DUF6311